MRVDHQLWYVTRGRLVRTGDFLCSYSGIMVVVISNHELSESKNKITYPPIVGRSLLMTSHQYISKN